MSRSLVAWHLAGLLLAVTSACSPQPTAGAWDAWLDSPGGELHFGLELEPEGEGWSATLVNAGERIAVPAVTVDGAQLKLDIDHYDSVIEATFSDDGRLLDGQWVKRRGLDDWTRMDFHARAGAAEKPLFQPADYFFGRWKVHFRSDEQAAAAILELDDEGHMSGTFLTTTGDYRYLTGGDDGVNMTLSCFDGAHAFLFKFQMDDMWMLRGDFWSRDSWHDEWSATRDDDFTLPDGFSLTRFVGDSDLSALSFPDLDGVPRSLDDPAFDGRARLIQVFGSWCPNCHDASALMSELHDTYGDQGLSIVGLAFELTGDLARDTEQVRRYAARHDVHYPLLVAGLADKAAASETLPFLDRVRSYPTTVFLHGDGRVRAVYQGFSGPATGAEYVALKAAFTGLIEELLAE